MADPFSIIAGTAGLTDVCIRLTKLLKQAKDGFQTVDDDLEELSEEIKVLRSVNDLIQRSYEAESTVNTGFDHRQVLLDHWHAAQTTLVGCQRIVRQIGDLLASVLAVGNGKHIKFDKLRRWLKQQSKEEAFNTLRQKLSAHQIGLQNILAAVNIDVAGNGILPNGIPPQSISMTALFIYNRNSQAISKQSHSELSRSIRDLGTDLETKFGSLQSIIHLSAERTLETAVKSAQKVVPLVSSNKHFYTPQTVSSIFTGRNRELNDLKQYLTVSPSTQPCKAQKRFVVFGLSGSGKTQFCCKFASDNKQSFWGVFWIDASSEEHAKQSFSTISTIGKVAPNQRAAKNWLSSLEQEQSWLLIIDNADDTNFPVEECFPDGTNGTILITSRNPMLKLYGTVGPRYYRFDELGETESIELLLKAADETMPWAPSSVSSASKIAGALGYLPLALIHAGKTILARLCTLETYLDFFEKNWVRIRRMKGTDSATSIADANAAIYCSYELIHASILAKNTQISEDALDLLKIFSFLHRQRIRLDIFLRAASNPGVELLERKRKEHEEQACSNRSRPKPTWAQTLKNVGIGIYEVFLELGNRSALPKFLCGTPDLKNFDELRLRQALKELFQMSLVSVDSNTEDCYSMHPAVHLWVRERPEMTLKEQAVWCQMTATILSRAILLPPLGDGEEDEIFRRELLPHVQHVRQIERAIQATYGENQKSRQRVWPILQPRLDRARALQLVKFSLIHAQGDQLEEAKNLQSYVANFATRSLGVEHTATMDIMLLLSITYWQLTRVDEAAKLQKQVLETCIRVRGQEDLKTLKIMDAYGSSLWQQGRVPEARQIHETVVEGLKKILGDSHVDTLRAKGNLGRAYGKDFRFTEAIKVHSEVFAGLGIKLGSTHLDTLIAMNDLAMAYYDRAAYGYGHPGDLDRALELESTVFAIRVEKLGREHLYTLWSGLNLSRIKAVRGETDEALSIFLPGHAIARRNLGEDHFGFLLGELHYGRILICARRYEEAKKILSGVVDSYRGPRKCNPDHLLAMFSLINCRHLLNKAEETIALHKELIGATAALFGPDHVAVKRLHDPQTLSKEPTIVLEQSTDSPG